MASVSCASAGELFAVALVSLTSAGEILLWQCFNGHRPASCEFVVGVNQKNLNTIT